jgi:hypothetical protein
VYRRSRQAAGKRALGGFAHSDLEPVSDLEFANFSRLIIQLLYDHTNAVIICQAKYAQEAHFAESGRPRTNSFAEKTYNCKLRTGNGQLRTAFSATEDTENTEPMEPQMNANECSLAPNHQSQIVNHKSRGFPLCIFVGVALQ